MYKKNKICCIIPARKNSVSIKNKNLQLINNKPLIYFPIKNALKSKLIDYISVNTDSDKIIDIVKKLGIENIYKRPKYLSRSSSKVYDAINHQIKNCNLENKFNIIVLLEATSPFSTANDIDKAIKKMVDNNMSSILSVSSKSIPNINYEVKISDKFIRKINKKIDKNRQNYQKRYFLCGLYYISYMKSYLKEKSFFQNKTGYVEYNNHKILEIDDNLDLEISRAVMQNFRCFKK